MCLSHNIIFWRERRVVRQHTYQSAKTKKWATTRTLLVTAIGKRVGWGNMAGASPGTLSGDLSPTVLGWPHTWHPQGPIHPQPHPVPLHVVHPCSRARRAVAWWRGGSPTCSGTGWRGGAVGPLWVPGLFSGHPVKAHKKCRGKRSGGQVSTINRGSTALHERHRMPIYRACVPDLSWDQGLPLPCFPDPFAYQSHSPANPKGRPFFSRTPISLPTSSPDWRTSQRNPLRQEV